MSTRPDGFAVTMADGWFVGIWDDRQNADLIVAKGKPADGRVVRPMVFADALPTHIIHFSGEGAEVILCFGWEDCKAKFFAGIYGHIDEFDQEEVKFWCALFANPDEWTRDEAGNLFSWGNDIGEISHACILQVTPTPEPPERP